MAALVGWRGVLASTSSSRALGGADQAGRLADGTDAEVHGRLRLDHKSVNC